MVINSQAKLVTTLATLLMALIWLFLGVGLLVLPHLQQVLSRPWIEALLSNVGALFIVSGALQLFWRLIEKRTFLAELLDKIGIAGDVVQAGITGVPEDFNHDINWNELFDDVRELDIFFAYGRTWRGNNERYLRLVAQDKRAVVRVVVPDPQDRLVIDTLATKFRKSAGQVQAEITDAIQFFHGIFESDTARAKYTLCLLKQPPVFSAYRFDGRAIIAFYKHRHGRGGVPSLIVKKGGSIFSFISHELDALTNPAEALSICERRGEQT